MSFNPAASDGKNGTPDGMALDAVLLDHWSPDADATALIAELRRNRPALPILLLTANESVAGAVAAMRAGASDFLVKPIAAERLLTDDGSAGFVIDVKIPGRIR